MLDRMESELEETNTKRLKLTKDNYAHIYQTLYTDIENNLTEDNHVYVNIARTDSIVTACLIRAIDALVGESTQSDSLKTHTNVHSDKEFRDQITLYRTQPKEEILPDVLDTYHKTWQFFQDTSLLDRQTETIKELRRLAETPDPSADEVIEEIYELATELKFRHDDIRESSIQQRKELGEHAQKLNEYGISQGVKEIQEGELSEPLPGPLNYEIRPMEWAILYTLKHMEGGKAESISDLIAHMSNISLNIIEREAKAIAEERKSINPEDLEASVQSLKDRDDLEWEKQLNSKLRSKIQYNLNNLVDKGFVEKEKTGRTYSISLSLAGDVWAEGKGLEDDMEQMIPKNKFSSIVGKAKLKLGVELDVTDDMMMVYSDLIDNIIQILEDQK